MDCYNIDLGRIDMLAGYFGCIDVFGIDVILFLHFDIKVQKQMQV